MQKTRKQIKLDQLHAHPKNPRKHLTVEDLTDSITESGQLVPVLVRPFKEGYQIISGHRRREAMERLGFITVDCDIVEMDDEQAFTALMTTNIQSQSLSEIEEAQGIRHMMDAYEWTQERVSKEFGKSKVWVSERLSTLSLPESVQEKVRARELTFTHAKQIARAPEEKQIEIATRVADEGLSTRETADLVKQITSIPNEPDPEPPQEPEKPWREIIHEEAEKSKSVTQDQVDRKKASDILQKLEFSIIDLNNPYYIDNILKFNMVDEALQQIDKIGELMSWVKTKLVNARDRPEPGTGEGTVLEFRRKAE